MLWLNDPKMRSPVIAATAALVLLMAVLPSAAASSDREDMRDTQKNLLDMFQRPYEPLEPRRVDGQIVPFSPHEEALNTSFQLLKAVPMKEAFSTFLTPHREAARKLMHLFENAQDVSELQQIARTVRESVNPGLFVFALQYAIKTREDLLGIKVPALPEIFPSSFFPHEELMRAQTEASKQPRERTEPFVVKSEYGPEFSGTLKKPENRVNYWREDIAFNSHHYYWHQSNPCWKVVNNDRKGESFYYMHHQILARYDIERLSAGLPRVEKLENFREPIVDGYFSKLYVTQSSSNYGGRQDNTILKDYRREQNTRDFVEITTLEMWRARLIDAIHLGYMIDRKGNQVPLSDNITLEEGAKRGIEILGDAFEADNYRSVNFEYYGDLHNKGHNIIAACHDSDSSHKEELGVMAFVETAVRDSVFFRWHKFVDYIFDMYKKLQPPYTHEELSLPWAKVKTVNIEVETMNVPSINNDTMYTRIKHKQYNLSKGLDFRTTFPVYINVSRLSHDMFFYFIKVNNDLAEAKDVTVRIFLAPKFNGRGQEMTYMEQRNLWAEMDKFSSTLHPGENEIYRSSLNSSITMSEHSTFEDIQGELEKEVSSASVDPEYFCQCGLPQHLLLPRGKPQGMPFQLFVMLTDAEIDKVEQPPGAKFCSNGMSYCGVYNGKYPDSRPMGFPFDRRVPDDFMENISTEDYFKKYPNIAVYDFKIQFEG